MTQIRLYLDEDIQKQALILALRNSGIDVLTTSEANRVSYLDEEQLIWATEQGRVIYSFNRRDFSSLHSQFLAEDRNHAGIILAQQQRYSVGEQMRVIMNLMATKSAEEMINNLEYLGAYIRDE